MQPCSKAIWRRSNGVRNSLEVAPQFFPIGLSPPGSVRSLRSELRVDDQPRSLEQLALQACRPERCRVTIGAVDQEGELVAEPARLASADRSCEVGEALPHFPLVAAGNGGARMRLVGKFDGKIDERATAKPRARDLIGDTGQQRVDLCARRAVELSHRLVPPPPIAP